MESFKHRMFALTLIAFLMTDLAFAQLYVDQDATGNNDGTSWEDAFSSLDSAIQRAQHGTEIWIAGGRYVRSTRLHFHDLNTAIYGSFDGTESSVDQRDLANETIIAGDLLGDDIPGMPDSNKIDNLQLIISAKESLGTLVIDGLVVEGAREGPNPDSTTIDSVEGGMKLAGNIELRNCQFRNNEAYEGGAVSIEFDPLAKLNRTRLIRCTFSKNQADKGGAIFIDSGGTEVYLQHCGFKDNYGINGGAIHCKDYDTNTSLYILESTFVSNESRFSGGCIFLKGDSARLTSTGCRYELNKSFRGGAIRAIETGPINVSQDTFIANSAGDGGALDLRDHVKLNINQSFFSANHAFVGACIYAKGHIETTLNNSTFTLNVVDDAAGVMYNEGTGNLQATNCLFADNKALDWGGVLYFYGQNTDLSYCIDRCKFRDNQSYEMAGAIWLESVDLKIVNSEFSNNIAMDDGIGNALTVSQYDIDQSIDIINSTFFENAGGLSTIAHWTISDTLSKITLLNSIMAGEGNHFADYHSQAGLTSMGSNICSNKSLESYLTDVSDLNATDPKFRSSEQFDFELQPTSPAINSALLDGAPTIDILERARDENPDRGAYEYQGTVSAIDIQPSPEKLVLTQNPVGQTLAASWRSNRRGYVLIRIMSAQGQTLYNTTLKKTADQHLINVAVEGLAPGSYLISVDDGAHKVTKFFQKY